MTGLLIKDFLCLKKNGKTFLTMALFYGVFFLLSRQQESGAEAAGFLSALVVVLSLTFVVNSFAFDELARWDRFAFSLPVTRRQVVLAKYLFTLILAAGAVVCVLPAVLFAVPGAERLQNLLSIAASSGVSLLLSSILIPLIYRFGLQKARIAVLLLSVAPFLLIMLVRQLNPSLFSGGAPMEAQILFWLKLSPALTLAVFCGSFGISCRILEKKEM